MLELSAQREASLLLRRHWSDGTLIPDLPPEIRPTTRAEGYAIQAHVMDASTKPLFGWKIAGTSGAGQKHINVNGPLAGRLLAERAVPDGATISLTGNHMRVAEVEFAFRFATDLPPRQMPYSVDEVMAAVGSLHPAIEIPDSRYENFCAVGAAQLIADNACAHLVLVGPATELDWRSIDLVQHKVSADLVGKSHCDGVGANALGDPRVALTWLVNELSDIGVTAHAGEVVITGTCVKPVDVLPGDSVIADYGIFGRLTVHFK